MSSEGHDLPSGPLAAKARNLHDAVIALAPEFTAGAKAAAGHNAG